jgi:enoyl-CoA hydratase/carnithine racemase
MDQQPTATQSQITCEIDDSIMIITLNRPDKLNAYTGAMGSEIEEAFREADVDDNVRAIIVTGSGRAFCAGADVSGGAASFDTSGQHGAGVFGNRPAGGGCVRAAALWMRSSVAGSPRLLPSTARGSASASP